MNSNRISQHRDICMLKRFHSLCTALYFTPIANRKEMCLKGHFIILLPAIIHSCKLYVPQSSKKCFAYFKGLLT